MPYFKNRPLRGDLFEELINKTNQAYMDDSLAVVLKIPTAIKPVELDSDKGTITLAYFDQKSTVDYIGNIQGIPVCFEAKETNRQSLPLSNFHSHQIEFMEKFTAQNGIAFVLVQFSIIEKIFMLPYSSLKGYWDRAENGNGRKSIPLDAFEHEVGIQGRYLVHYLEQVGDLLGLLRSNND
ncbi:MAG: Holliday junction resolvase RecU [Eubacteriaceae bacterium]|jgi:recombination protein U|nr:Holliday junction resolvase RecU [Eubacteriaceae bacterium]